MTPAARHFALTLVDRSPAMLAVSRALNPDCEHVTDDMRTVRLGRIFDLVFVTTPSRTSPPRTIFGRPSRPRPSTAVGRGRPLRARLLARRSSPAHGTVATTARAAAFVTWSGCGIRTRLTRSTRLTSPTCYETRTVRSASSGIVTSTGCSPATSGRDGSRAQASRRMFGRRRTRSTPEAASCSWHGGSPRARGRPRGLRGPRARLAGARRSRRRGTPEALRRGAAR